MENCPALVETMATSRPLLGNSCTPLRQARDPALLQAAARSAGVCFPETRASIAGLPRDGSWLCKTYGGASGSGVWRLDGDAAVVRAARDGAVCQQFVPGVSACAVFVVADGGARLLGLTQQWIGGDAAHRWRYVGSIGPLERAPAVDQQLAAIGAMLGEPLKLRGLVGVDLVLAGERVWVIEVNPRYSASVEILERAVGVAAIAAHVAACDPCAMPHTLDDVFAKAAPLDGRVHAKQILFAARSTTVSDELFEWAMSQSSLNAADCHLADIPHAGEVIPAGRPVLTAFAAGDDFEDCSRRLRARIADVESQLEGAAAGGAT